MTQDANRPFSCTIENSRWTYFYDPGYISGPPEKCYPSDFELEDLQDGGITVYMNGTPVIDIYDSMEECECEDGYAYGSETAFSQDIEHIVDILNDAWEEICTSTDGEYDDDYELIVDDDVNSWKEVFMLDLPNDWEFEELAGMPNFADFKAKRRCC